MDSFFFFFFLSVKWIITFRCNTLDYALLCAKPNQMRQISPGAFGREEGCCPGLGHNQGVLGAAVPAWDRQAGCHQAGGVTWALIWASNCSGKSPGIFIFPMQPVPLCILSGAVHPSQSLHGAGISWSLLPLGCAFFFFSLSSVAWCNCEKNI